MTLRIGLIGAGANTRLQHIPGFQGIDGVEITAVCNRSRESGQKIADEYGIHRVFDQWEDLVHSDDVDAISLELLGDATMDWVDDPFRPTFHFTPPTGASSCGCGNSFTL